MSGIQYLNKKTPKGATFQVVVCSAHQRGLCHICGMDFNESNTTTKRDAIRADALLCHSTECCNVASLTCSKCRMARYCSKECQKLHWSIHKRVCKDRDAVGSKPMRVNIACGDEPDEFVDVLPLGTKVSLVTGSVKGDMHGKIVGFLPGTGPFANPEVKLDYNNPEHKAFLSSHRSPFDSSEDEMFCRYSIKTKESGEIWEQECSELHTRWNIHEKGKNIEKVDLATVVSIPCNFLYPSTSRVLLVSNFGYFESSSCYYSKAIQAMLHLHDIPFDIFDFKENVEFCQKLQLGIYSACVMIGFGSAGPELFKSFDKVDMKQTLKNWTMQGGIVVVQGEGCLGALLQKFFDLQWGVHGYHRSTQNLNTRSGASHTLSIDLMSKLPESYFAKCVYFANVPENCQIFRDCDDAKFVSGAVSAIGDSGGCIAVFGDVNAEEGTVVTIVNICIGRLRS